MRYSSNVIPFVTSLLDVGYKSIIRSVNDFSLQFGISLIILQDKFGICSYLFEPFFCVFQPSGIPHISMKE